jgi:hypothetical protein
MLSSTIDVDGLKIFCRQGRVSWPAYFDIEMDCVAAL